MAFTASTSLGATERLPEGLFRGLTSLRNLQISDCGFQNLPNLDDLKARAMHVHRVARCPAPRQHAVHVLHVLRALPTPHPLHPLHPPHPLRLLAPALALGPACTPAGWCSAGCPQLILPCIIIILRRAPSCVTATRAHGMATTSGVDLPVRLHVQRGTLPHGTKRVRSSSTTSSHSTPSAWPRRVRSLRSGKHNPTNEPRVV